MRVLMIGDIVGEPGRKLAIAAIPLLRRHESLDLVVANAENVAGGSGITARCHAQLAGAGIDVLTMGDHLYRQKEVMGLFGKRPPIVKPANLPAEAAGPDHAIVEAGGFRVAVLSLLGRTFMKPCDCPFKAADRVLAGLPADVRTILVDVHAEATSEKQLLLRHLRGRVTAVVGTHTHVQTADGHVTADGTAYLTDLGMTGPYDGIIGRRWEPVLHNAKTGEPRPFDVATGDPRLCGAIVDFDPETGRATALRPVQLTAAAVAELAADVK